MAKNRKILTYLVGTVMMLAGILVPCGAVSAFTVSPQDQEYVLTPGQSVTGEVRAFNPSDEKGDFYYIVEVVPFSVSGDGKYSPSFDTRNDYTDIVNWVTISDGDESGAEEVHGVLRPGEEGKAYYTITVPKDAKGGGQYFGVRVKTDAEATQKATSNDTVAIKEVLGIVSLVYVEVSGDIVVKGEIMDNNIPSFVLTPPISASFVVKNEGNTHAKISYGMQVFPLFSNEEVYTTEEDMGSSYVLPGATRMVTQSWDNSPVVGVFRVRQTVYYDSTDNEPSVTEKIVIICPIWLIFIILFVIFALIFYFVAKAKARKKAAKSKSNQN